MHVYQWLITNRTSERKFFRGYEDRYRAPKSCWAPQALSGPMALNHFLPAGCRSSFKRGDNDIRILVGIMKNTNRHQIGLNPARGFGFIVQYHVKVDIIDVV